MRTALVLTPLLLLAACGGGEDGNVATSAPTSAPVGAASPPAGKTWVDVVAKSPAGGFVQGNPEAPIKLVEYGSRTCPTCARFAMEGVEPLRQKYISTGKVSYEFRDFLVHGAPDLAAALLNQCAATDAFFPILDQMYANQDSFIARQQQLPEQLAAQLQTMTPAQAAAALGEALGYIDFVKQRGIPEEKARQCLADTKQIESIAKVHADGASVHGVSSTPNFFINGEKVDAAVWAQLEPMLQAAGAR